MNITQNDYGAINNFFCKVLNKGKNKKTVCGRFDIESIPLKRKTDFVCNVLNSFNADFAICRIFFGEKNETIESFFKKQMPDKKYVIYKNYNNRMTPGICFVYISEDMIPFLKMLLINHFNFELARIPSLSVRVQIGIYAKSCGFLLDIYDDRGFFMHILKSSKEIAEMEKMQEEYFKDK